MQQKLSRKLLILAVIIGLTITAVYYAYGSSRPKDSPITSGQTAQEKTKTPSPPEPGKQSTQVTTLQPDVVGEEDEKQSNSDIGGPAAEPVKHQAETVAQAPTPAAAKPLPSTKPVEVSRSLPATYQPKSNYPKLSKQQGSFGQFYYREAAGGRIEVDPQWIADNIVTIVLPGINRTVQVHKAAADRFITAFNYIKNGTAVINGRTVSLLSLVKTMDGTFVTRHVNWNPSRGLSNHSWGIAIDINANDHFCYIDPATKPNDPNLILWEKAFKPAGFSWGNSYADSMHYELLY